MVRTTTGAVFGCYGTELWRPVKDKTYYGGGECFLFVVRPEPKVYQWTTKNRLFQTATAADIMIGGGHGQPGLWLDAAFENGASHPCPTFGNAPLAPTEDFKVNGVEVWGFERAEDF